MGFENYGTVVYDQQFDGCEQHMGHTKCPAAITVREGSVAMASKMALSRECMWVYTKCKHCQSGTSHRLAGGAVTQRERTVEKVLYCTR